MKNQPKKESNSKNYQSEGANTMKSRADMLILQTSHRDNRGKIIQLPKKYKENKQHQHHHPKQSYINRQETTMTTNSPKPCN